MMDATAFRTIMVEMKRGKPCWCHCFPVRGPWGRHSDLCGRVRALVEPERETL